MTSFGSLKSTIFDKEEKKQQYQSHIRGLNAYDRHKKFINDYVNFYGKERPSNFKLPIKTDQDTLREGYRFIRSEEDDLDPSWEQRLVKRYYDKLFKEYCLADMSQYKSGKIGLRWRTEKEVMSGKGQFICGNKHCNEKDGLASYEVNFCYSEAGENKQALVKLVTCERCACKLNYKRQKEKEQLEKRQQEQDRRKRNRSKSDDDLDDFQESKEIRRKGKRALTSASDHKIDDDNDEDDNLDEFLEGMFP
ncbi:Protein FRA10AC1-like protein [Mucuna pruriens]|uniref:Protein FRA10AC1-like protein n=1 Tax=Mucuna pruriens TaxID=157652 RepID=A0A371G6E0_MUCPR|nr:Protein FRA10AC1-like protein [Mucuna pruriens]